MPSNRRKTLLSHTRPHAPYSSHIPTKRSSTSTRSLIRTHHTLQKRLALARATGDVELAAALETQIAAHGGLALYQRVSMLGQSAERGGDSGRVLRSWVEESFSRTAGEEKRCSKKTKSKKIFRMLEVGALKVDNACSRSPRFDIERIDLQSQHHRIQKQDFMQRPLPSTTDEKFDIVSLSLVLNYVGTSKARGEMLQRVYKFLTQSRHQTATDHKNSSHHDGGERAYPDSEVGAEEGEFSGPGLFLVLPAACVTNSRYLDERGLEDMMRQLGYARTRRKMSKKLVYYFWRFVGAGGDKDLEEDSKFEKAPRLFRKKEIRPGAKRNNFWIEL
ncbi:hypothetical protein MMC07_002001 [Pseudocyphellaria aurata]|nr:hypothetical protein [Pseudocyphellaria aurata]